MKKLCISLLFIITQQCAGSLVDPIINHYVRLRSHKNGNYLVVRAGNVDRGEPVWVLKADTLDAGDPATKFLVLLKKINNLELLQFQSDFAAKGLLHGSTKKLGENDVGFEKIATWQIRGENLEECGIQDVSTKSDLYVLDNSFTKVGGELWPAKSATYAIELVTNDPLRITTKIADPADGPLNQISVGSPVHIWGRKDQSLYEWMTDTSTWKKFPGKFADFSVGGDGIIVAIEAQLNNTLFQRGITRWNYKRGDIHQLNVDQNEVMTKIAVGNEKHLWMISSENNIYHWIDNVWQRTPDLPGLKPLQISVGSDGTTVCIAVDNTLYRYQANAWVQMPGKMNYISVGDSNSIWGIGLDNKIYWFDKTNFVLIPGPRFWVWENNIWKKPIFKQISVAKGGLSLWGLSTQNDIYQCSALVTKKPKLTT